GKAAIFYGKEDFFDDKAGHILVKNQPLAICDKTAATLANLNRNDIYISESTFHYDGGGCC
ncbi:SAM-dependent methyltransferase, partial [bacterium]|nr:SAM-dependent methyltransferase [bacterium]